METEVDKKLHNLKVELQSTMDDLAAINRGLLQICPTALEWTRPAIEELEEAIVEIEERIS